MRRKRQRKGRHFPMHLTFTTALEGGIFKVPSPTFYQKHFLMFLYFWRRERQTMSRGGAESQGDTESKAGSRLWAASIEPNGGLELTDHEIMTWTEVGRLTEPPRCPSPPFFLQMEKMRLKGVRAFGQIPTKTHVCISVLNSGPCPFVATIWASS